MPLKILAAGAIVLIRRLSDCRAPGLEQEHNCRSLDWCGFHGAVRDRRCLGCAHAVWAVALKSNYRDPEGAGRCYRTRS